MRRGKGWLIGGAFVVAIAVLVVSVRVVAPSGGGEPAPAPPGDALAGETASPAAGDGAGAGAPEDASTAPPVALDHTLGVAVRRWPDGEAVAGARVSVATEERTLVREARTSAYGRASLSVPAGVARVWVGARALDHDEAEAWLDLDGLDGEAVLELAPRRGWIGRVVDELGAPVAHARVGAGRFWPPRPALLDREDGSPARIVSRQGIAPATVTAPTNDEGYYYVEPFDDGNVVDLVLAVVGTELATERVRVPLPLPDTRLPDLVVAPVAPLRGRVLDTLGRPVGGAVVSLDRGIGRERRVEEEVVTDANGEFVAPRALAPLHVRVEQTDHWLEVARADGRELDVDEPWIEVGLETAVLAMELAAAEHVRGRALDAATGLPVDSAVAVVTRLQAGGGRQTVAEGVTDGDGGYDVLVPVARGGERLELDLSAPGYRTLTRAAVSELDASLPPRVDYLTLASDASTVVGRVHSPGGLPAGDATVRVWVSESPSPWDRYEVRTSGVPASYRLERDGPVELDGSFEWHTTARPSDHVLVFGHRPSRDGLVEWGSRGPEPLHTHRSRELIVGLDRSVALAVHVHGEAPAGRPFLEHSAWHPLGEAVWSRSVPLSTTARETVVSVAGPLSGFSFLEVRLDRGPVSAPVPRSTTGSTSVGSPPTGST